MSQLSTGNQEKEFQSDEVILAESYCTLGQDQAAPVKNLVVGAWFNCEYAVTGKAAF